MEELKKVKELLLKNKNKRIFSENVVFEYDGFFYKYPNFVGKYMFYRGVNPYIFMKSSYLLLKEYFSKDFHLVEADIFDDKELGYIIKQKKIHGRMLLRSDFKDEKLKETLKKLMLVNKKMWKEKGFFLDILGTDAINDPFKLYNLMISDGEIYIFDYGLLNKKSRSWTFRFFSIFFYYIQVFWIEHVLLKRF